MKTGIQNIIIALAWLALPALVQAQFTFTTNSGAITITHYTGTGGAVVIPAATNGYPVTSIAADAFQSHQTVTSVTIPNSVISIGDGAFSGCYGLANVTISNSVTNVGDGAFYDCNSLTTAIFHGNAPPDVGTAFTGDYGSDPATVYYLPGATGWGLTFGGVPAVLLNLQANMFAFTGGYFGFSLNGPASVPVVVEACTNLSHPVWLPVATNTFSGGGMFPFSDSQSGGYHSRFYRFTLL